MRNKASKNLKTEFDKDIKDIADYIVNYSVDSELAIETSYYVLLDSIACGIQPHTPYIGFCFYASH